MRIKHWAGYGHVNAEKISRKGNKLDILVYGNHEYGLVRDDNCDIYRWLVKRFARNSVGIVDMTIEELPYRKGEDGTDIEQVVYHVEVY